MTDKMIETIRMAVADGATAEQRSAGATACRTLCIALEATSGIPLGPTTTAATAVAAPMSPLVAAAVALRGVPPDQLLDILIAKLRSAVPPGAAAASAAIPRINIPLVKVTP